MNPSAGELVDAIDALGGWARHRPAQQQKHRLDGGAGLDFDPDSGDGRPDDVAAQAVTATFHFDPGLPVDEIVAKMSQAVREIRTAEVTRAARDARVNGADVQQGDIIALSEGNLLCATSELDEALVRTVRGLAPNPASWSPCITAKRWPKKRPVPHQRSAPARVSPVRDRGLLRRPARLYVFDFGRMTVER